MPHELRLLDVDLAYAAALVVGAETRDLPVAPFYLAQQMAGLLQSLDCLMRGVVILLQHQVLVESKLLHDLRIPLLVHSRCRSSVFELYAVRDPGGYRATLSWPANIPEASELSRWGKLALQHGAGQSTASCRLCSA